MFGQATSSRPPGASSQELPLRSVLKRVVDVLEQVPL